ncbi:MAG: hypothetical protein JO112_05605, partial [Planctomycetes bacterium]|nr:hypothetical protein [Planctomycetota bacterium]
MTNWRRSPAVRNHGGGASEKRFRAMTREGPQNSAGPGRRRALLHAGTVLGGFTLLHLLLISPILRARALVLEGGDSVRYHFPAVYERLTLWEPNILAGSPRLADPQMMTWYPPAMLLRWTGVEWLWNPFALMPPILASVFT